jgi:hypothetical protein
MVELVPTMEVHIRVLVVQFGAATIAKQQTRADRARVKMVELVPTMEVHIRVLALRDGLDQAAKKWRIHAVPNRAKMAARAHQVEHLIPAIVFPVGLAQTALRRSTFA